MSDNEKTTLDGEKLAEAEVNPENIKSPEQESEDNTKKKKSGIWYWIRDIVIAVILALILLQFINPTMVRQESMMETLHDGDYIFINKQAYRFGDVKHGDIIVFQTEELDEKGNPKKLIKRAIALPGDTLEISDGKVYLNDKELSESYIREPYTDGEIERTVVPENKVFAMGDNRAYSHDSRESDIGFIDLDSVKGKAIFRIYPFGDIGIIK